MLATTGHGVLLALMLVLGLSAAARPAVPAKPPMRGLVSMGNIEFHRHDGGIPDNSLASIAARPGIFDGVAINIAWSQIEPREGALDATAIDQALDQVRAYNGRNPGRPLAVTLRIWAGPNAPDWAKNLGGPPVGILRIFPKQPVQIVTIGRFWHADYRRAFAALQRSLAERYDADPLIRDVSNTSCSSLSDEPFLIAADPISLLHMHDAGYSDAALRACLLDSIQDYAEWRLTNVELSLNPFRGTDSGRPVLEPEITLEIACAFRQALAGRAVLANHALSEPEHPWLHPINQMIRRLGPPIVFQTEAPKAGQGLDWDATIRSAIALGAGAVEVWTGPAVGGFELFPDSQLRSWSAALNRAMHDAAAEDCRTRR